MPIIKIYPIAIVLLMVIGTGCKKYLDKKQDQGLTVPQSLNDLQALMDNNTVMNLGANGQGEIAADNYYLSDANWASLSAQGDRNAYIWGDEIVFTPLTNVWQSFYQTVYYANTVLGSVGNISLKQQDSTAANNLKGEALFFRARAFHSLVLCCAKVYDSATAATDMGIPVRTGTDFNVVSVRASVKETYDQIISDLLSAIPLLPVQAVHVMRPSRPAAYGLLARTYMSMGDYVDAFKYADMGLKLNSTLIDYNNLVATAAYPVPQFNAEVLFHAAALPTPLNVSRARVDSVLYGSYAANDLRKAVFFIRNTDNSYGFKGSYNGSASLFFGVATDEMYFMRAECYARLGNIAGAMNDLNTVLAKRWKVGTFVPYTAATQQDALQTVMTERRKELLMRDLRWMDIKRFNRDGGNIVPTRKLSGTIYQLQPNENRYALPIPAYVIGLTGMPQNQR